MTGLAPKTLRIFQTVTQLACINDYILVGGTALSLQINHRLSEDLDFCRWPASRSPENAIPFRTLEIELKKHFDSVEANPIDFDQVDFLINREVKFQFFNEVGYTPIRLETLISMGALKIAPIATISAMKVKTMFQRNVFRDYYDVYSIIRGKYVTLSNLIDLACQYNNRLNPSMIARRLIMYKKFKLESSFPTLSPIYSDSVEEIGRFFEEEVSNLSILRSPSGS